MKTIIGKFKMMPVDDGLVVKDIYDLLKDIGNEMVVPVTNLNSDIEANSAAMGFILNEYYDHVDQVLEKLTSVCNDWDLETEDGLYCVNESDRLYVHLDRVDTVYSELAENEFSVTFTLEDMTKE